MKSASFLRLCMLTLLVGFTRNADAMTREPLWPAGAPDAHGTAPADTPTLDLYPAPDAATATGQAIVICPGGGYGHLATNHEGRAIAAWLNKNGIAAAVLEYRMRARGYGHPAPLNDAQRAVRTLRSRAAELKIDPAKIGILGFSAGGHLAATAATQFTAGVPDAADPVERCSSRPDFAILCYPVIAFGQPCTHLGSQHNLIGKEAPQAQIDALSAEKQVTAATPPCFLWHTDADKSVPPENSILFYQACRRAGVPAELHIYRAGPHGRGLAADIPGTRDWPDACIAWLKTLGKK